jgi:hypothetical protein
VSGEEPGCKPARNTCVLRHLMLLPGASAAAVALLSCCLDVFDRVCNHHYCAHKMAFNLTQHVKLYCDGEHTMTTVPLCVNFLNRSPRVLTANIKWSSGQHNLLKMEAIGMLPP